jgi:hypothetical protein
MNLSNIISLQATLQNLDLKSNGSTIKLEVLRAYVLYPWTTLEEDYSNHPNTEPWSVFGLNLMPVPTI